MTPNPVVIGVAYSPSFLRSPYADPVESLNPTIHAVTRSRGGNQSTHLSAPDSRYERTNRAAEATETVGAPYLGLTRVAS